MPLQQITRTFSPWTRFDCEQCGQNFQLTRSTGNSFDGIIKCGCCVTYDEAYNIGYQAALNNKSTINEIVLDAVEGDFLPKIGSKVQILLASTEQWVDVIVVGYYVWKAFNNIDWRVNIRVIDKDGVLNARSLNDIKVLDSSGNFVHIENLK